VLFDLNNFKQINDRFGHPAGDQVLKVFAERLGEAIREVDLSARLGGDEFMLLLPECDSMPAGSAAAPRIHRSWLRRKAGVGGLFRRVVRVRDWKGFRSHVPGG
jgi:diguanylate cyclase (GGDEF)-like protein